MIKKTAAFIIAVFLLIPKAYTAYDYRFDSKDDLKGQFESSSGEKLSRGLTNILFGWVEIAQTPAQRAAGIEHGKVNAFLLGLPHGLMRFAGRTLVGCYEVATCYAPQSPIMPDLAGQVL